jgi:hypothetical protein
MAEKLWDLANLITSFAILQTIATTFAITKGDITGFKGWNAHLFGLVGGAVFAFFYVIAIAWCGVVGSSLDKPDSSFVWNVVTLGRVGGVLLFTVVFAGALWGHWRGETEQTKPPRAVSV